MIVLTRALLPGDVASSRHTAWSAADRGARLNLEHRTPI